jgi:hypothetical protein
MVPKGLKIGDTFEDGKRLYVVEAVNRDGTYYSRAVENTTRPAATPLASDGGKGKRRTKKQ